eukprot:TRINITY_DN27105_c0_g1_i1.p1 TRINITY_DN27105_c0_g1~~TRINITY_DN27105_c0_g1_i1.p1  ORF type:complete len:144 (+),score=32.54 TRINITY_DN27105_c0_g1_i1:59-433(+)
MALWRRCQRLFQSRLFSTTPSSSQNANLSEDLSKLIRDAIVQRKNVRNVVEEFLASKKPEQPPKETKPDLSLRPPQPVAGPRKPIGLRRKMELIDGKWPLPHPNWYNYPTQKKYKPRKASAVRK